MLSRGLAMRAGFLLFLLSSSSLAQTLQLQVAGGTQYTVAASGCDRELSGTWTVQVSGITCSPLVIWATEGQCGDAQGTGDFKVIEIPQATLTAQPQGTFTLRVVDLPGFVSTPCGTPNVERVHRVCGAFSYTTGFDCSAAKSIVKPATVPTVTYDAMPPSAPAISELVEQDSALTARLVIPSGALTIDVEARPAGSDQVAARVSQSAELTSARLGFLENGTAYEVTAVAEDSAGNRSAPSAPLVGTPVETEGFWTIYRRNGGTENGCSSVPGAAGALAALVAARASRRKRS